MLEKQDRDDAVKERYGLGEEIDLGDEAVDGGREEWKAGRADKGLHILGSSSLPSSGLPFSVKGVDHSTGQQKGNSKGRLSDSPAHLAEVLRKSTAKKYNPFDSPVIGFGSSSPSSTMLKPQHPKLEVLGSRGRMKEMAISKRKKSVEGRVVSVADDSFGNVSFGLLSGYESD